jgi:hypothetical protein
MAKVIRKWSETRHHFMDISLAPPKEKEEEKLPFKFIEFP